MAVDKNIHSTSAYHNGSWQYRTDSHKDECKKNSAWNFRGYNCEFAPLRKVVVFDPQSQPLEISDPEAVQHLRPMDWDKFYKESQNLKSFFTSQNIDVELLRADDFSNPPPNIMFARDHFLMTPWGAILSRMASPIRRGEEKWAQLTLARAGVPILGFIHGNGLFEGADALWLNPQMLLLGVGNRTNNEAALQIQNILEVYGVQVALIPLPKTVQHLLGLMQFVSEETALVRTDILDAAILKKLQSHFPHCISIRETSEVTHRQGMNVVCLRPNTIVMPTNCPELKSIYTREGIDVAAEIEISQYLNAAGGIACSVGIISRHE